MRRRHAIGLTLLATALAVGSSGSRAEDAAADAMLMDAIRAGDAAAARTALDDGADPDHATVAPMLVLATTRGDPALVGALLGAGANPDAIDPRGRPVLALAGTGGHLDIVELLLENGADVDLREGSPGRSILQLVIDDASEPSLAVLGALLDAGADVDARDERGESALASAAFMNRYDAAAFLLERGADAAGENNDGVTPRRWAERNGNERIVELLSEAGAR